MDEVRGKYWCVHWHIGVSGGEGGRDDIVVF